MISVKDALKIARKAELRRDMRSWQGWIRIGRRWARQSWKGARQCWEWVSHHPRTTISVSGATGAIALLVLLITYWKSYKEQREAFAPLFTLAAGLAVAGVTLMRHFAQTEADRQRRITESFSKAIEQLGSDKLEIRVGAIYTLERISQESARDHEAIIDNLTTFVRERTKSEAARLAKPLHQRLAERAYFLWERAGRPEQNAGRPQRTTDGRHCRRVDRNRPTQRGGSQTPIRGREASRFRSSCLEVCLVVRGPSRTRLPQGCPS
jgi:hypothetical protein